MYKEWKEHWLTGRVNPGKTWEWAITKSPAETGQVVSPQRSWVSLCMCHPKYDTSITSFPPDKALPESWNGWIREKKEIFLLSTETSSIRTSNCTTMLHSTYTNKQSYQSHWNFQITLLSMLRIYITNKQASEKSLITLGEVSYQDHTHNKRHVVKTE